MNHVFLSLLLGVSYGYLAGNANARGKFFGMMDSAVSNINAMLTSKGDESAPEANKDTAKTE